MIQNPKNSALALLVSGFCATDHPDGAVTLDELAITAHLFYRSTYFHDSLHYRQSYRRSAQKAASTVTLKISFLHQRLILMRHQV